MKGTCTLFKHNQQPSRGFTLIELLVVIAIIALLMGILMPALRAAKRQAHSAVCKAQLKQWALCYSLYTGDHDGRFPAWDIGLEQRTFMESLRNYYQDAKKLRACPAAPSVSQENPTGGQPESYFGFTFKAWQIDPSAEWLKDTDWGMGSYAENTWIRNIGADAWATRTKIKQPNNVPLLADGRWCNANPVNGEKTNASRDETVTYSIGNWSSMSCYAMRRHRDGVNVALADGTIRQVSAEDLWELKWHRNFETKDDMDLRNP
jgi:prepilin-type N-terminal cleavage/methylation domain-containing protein